MKSFFLIFLTISFSSFASDSKSLMKYHFKSDTVHSEVPMGKCLIIGNVKSKGNPLPDGVVSTIKHKYSGTTDLNGNYRLLIPAQEIELYFFKPHYGEIVTHKYNFRSGHKVVLDFFAYEDLIMIEVDKPVVYFYADNEIDVSVKLEAKGEVNFSYPIYNEEWKFTITDSGLKTDCEEPKTYPYLFWEGTQTGLYYKDNQGELYGDIVAKKDVISFLEKKLTQLGLNAIETTDFITFWGPRMTKYNNVFVQFIVDEDYSELISEMIISPKPISSRRIYLLFSEVIPDNIVVKEPKLSPPFVRKGYTVVEWGGSEINLQQDLTLNK